MPFKCVRSAEGKCDKDAEILITGTAYCKEHGKKKLEDMGKIFVEIDERTKKFKKGE